MGFRPRSVNTTSLMVWSPWKVGPSRRFRRIGREIRRARPGASSTNARTRLHFVSFLVRKRRSGRSIPGRAPCEHTACDALPCETLRAHNDLAMHRKKETFSPGERSDLPDDAARFFPESGGGRGESFPSVSPRLPLPLFRWMLQRPERRKEAAP